MKAYLTKWVPPRDDFLSTITDHEKELFRQHGDWQAGLREQRLIVAHGPVIDPAGSYGVRIVGGRGRCGHCGAHGAGPNLQGRRRPLRALPDAAAEARG